MDATRPRAGYPAATISDFNRNRSISIKDRFHICQAPRPLIRQCGLCRRVSLHSRSVSVRSETSTQATERADKVKKDTYQRVKTTFWACERDISVRAVVYRHAVTKDLEVRVTVTGSQQTAVPQLLWGVYRSSPQAWQHPEGMAPPESHVDPSTGAMLSPMTRTSDREKLWTAKFSIPVSLIPLTFVFHLRIVYQETGGQSKPDFVTIFPLVGRSITSPMAVQLGLEAGRASPLGPSIISSSSVDTPMAVQNFAVFCRGASSVSLVLVSGTNTKGGRGGGLKAMEIALDAGINRTGDVWHVGLPLHMLPDTSQGEGINVFGYGWRLDGDVSWGEGFRISPSTVLVDPFARSILYVESNAEDVDEFKKRFGLRVPNVSKIPLVGLSVPQKEEMERVLVLASCQGGMTLNSEINNVARSLQLPLESLCVLDLRKKELESIISSSDALNAKLAGFKALGINAVILPPCYATDGAGRVVSFMAVNPLLVASSGCGTSQVAEVEFQRMVGAFHENGIEIYMTVDTTLSADGEDSQENSKGESSGPVSLRGLNHAAYYRPNGVLNMGNPAMQEVLLASLRRWAIEFGIDGFFFVHAENLTQDSQGVVMDAPLIAQRLCLDPVLSHVKLIAAPSDENLLPRNGRRGFPHWGLWSERNSAFRRDVVDFWSCRPNGPSAIARRLTGSAEVFDAEWSDGEGIPGSLAAGRRPSFSFNALDDFSQSLVAEVSKEEFESFEMDRVLRKSLIFTSLIAQGTPVLREGDVQDDGEMSRFVGIMVRWRRRLASLLLPPRFDSPRNLSWHRADGNEPVWEEGAGQDFLGFSVEGQAARVFVGLNPLTVAVTAQLPSVGSASVWRRIVDTSLPPPEDAIMPCPTPDQSGEQETGLVVGSSVVVGPKAAVLCVWGL